jgi:hypothetical protein
VTKLHDPAIDEKKKRKALMDQRASLFAQFLKNPHDIKLAITIRENDDQLVGGRSS